MFHLTTFGQNICTVYAEYRLNMYYKLIFNWVGLSVYSNSDLYLFTLIPLCFSLKAILSEYPWNYTLWSIFRICNAVPDFTRVLRKAPTKNSGMQHINQSSLQYHIYVWVLPILHKINFNICYTLKENSVRKKNPDFSFKLVSIHQYNLQREAPNRGQF